MFRFIRVSPNKSQDSGYSDTEDAWLKADEQAAAADHRPSGQPANRSTGSAGQYRGQVEFDVRAGQHVGHQAERPDNQPGHYSYSQTVRHQRRLPPAKLAYYRRAKSADRGQASADCRTSPPAAAPVAQPGDRQIPFTPQFYRTGHNKRGISGNNDASQRIDNGHSFLEGGSLSSRGMSPNTLGSSSPNSGSGSPASGTRVSPTAAGASGQRIRANSTSSTTESSGRGTRTGSGQNASPSTIPGMDSEFLRRLNATLERQPISAPAPAPR